MKIGFTELVVIVIVAFVFIGPNQLPEYARKLGKMLRDLRKYTSTASKDIQENIVEPLNEIQQPIKEAISPLTDIKKDLDNSVKDVTKSFAGIGKTSKPRLRPRPLPPRNRWKSWRSWARIPPPPPRLHLPPRLLRPPPRLLPLLKPHPPLRLPLLPRLPLSPPQLPRLRPKPARPALRFELCPTTLQQAAERGCVD